jgi:hypothetical protein
VTARSADAAPGTVAAEGMAPPGPRAHVARE